MNKIKLLAASLALISVTAHAGVRDIGQLDHGTFFEDTFGVSLSGKTPSFSETIKFSLLPASDLSTTIWLNQRGNFNGLLQFVTASITDKTGKVLWTESKYGTKGFAAELGSLLSPGGEYNLNLSGKLANGASSYNGKFSYSLNVSAVPEPETYALMGLGLTALLLRRRKRF
ncbi:FxDxF family PEP-CTERM protein [Paludibacterium paludis]|uniref:Ice-binding protein C-terminal domain-containing protein n=1 Tax=Paludibacterium paludis TaxID=1225769 RepID=A0A918P4Q7_9NEIS|nr:FxDxF family PEP-CTERM protein [Paludibacterium paludis]GGY19253.1 hypothetical protein GCM10011289_23450 [Paludibacterium paludis]